MQELRCCPKNLKHCPSLLAATRERVSENDGKRMYLFKTKSYLEDVVLIIEERMIVIA